MITEERYQAFKDLVEADRKRVEEKVFLARLKGEYYQPNLFELRAIGYFQVRQVSVTPPKFIGLIPKDSAKFNTFRAAFRLFGHLDNRLVNGITYRAGYLHVIDFFEYCYEIIPEPFDEEELHSFALLYLEEISENG